MQNAIPRGQENGDLLVIAELALRENRDTMVRVGEQPPYRGGQMTAEQQANHDAYRRLRESINRDFPAGRYVAISGGRIVGDAACFEELDRSLREQGNASPSVLVVQAGADYPQTVTILDWQPYADPPQALPWQAIPRR